MIGTIEQAFLADFAAMVLSPGVGRVYPNIPYSGAKPYVASTFLHTNVAGLGLKNTPSQYDGFFVLTSVIELGLGVKGASDLTALIAARYPLGRQLTVTTGTLEISAPIFALDGFRQETDWRTPIRVPYRGFF
jgi:hypothetical protein